MLTKTINGFVFLCALTLFMACSESKNPSPEVQVKSAATDTTETTKDLAWTEPVAPAEAVPVVATISAPDYEATLHKAIAFVPKDDGLGLMKVKYGHRYVVLDISVKNVSKNKEIDMGQILLSTKVKDVKGKEYSMNAMAIAAYTLQNPDPHHQAQYNAMWGKIKPGEFYRTTAYGLEVPENAKSFVLSMKEDGDIFKESKRYEAKFTVE